VQHQRRCATLSAVAVFDFVRRRRERVTCQRAVELVTDYLEGALPPAERARLEHHLRGCAGCTAYVDQMRLAIAALGQVEPAPPEPAVRAELIELYRRYHNS
jgi:predicted anti-sigma-YlaC factor YlaD